MKTEVSLDDTESQELFPGYRAIKVDEGAGGMVGYKVFGPRSGWMLIRNHYDCTLLFAVPLRTMGTGSIRGHSWFTDRHGRLEVA